MKLFRYEDSLAELTASPVSTIFLAGPTVRGHQPHLTSWRFAAIDEFERRHFDGALILPEFTSRVESDKGKLWIPRWEFAGLTGCDTIMFWIPRTKELIGLTTNFELGYWLARMRDKMVYGRPDDSYRNTYIDLMWEVDALQNEGHCPPILTTLADTVAASIKQARAAFADGRSKRVKSKVSVASPYGTF